MTPQEFRQVWNILMAASKANQTNARLDDSALVPDVEAAQSKFDSLTDFGIQLIIASFPDPDLFARYVAELVATTNKLEESADQATKSQTTPAPWSSLLAPLAAPTLFSPGYPTGNDYDVFTATLGGLGLLFDGPDDGTATNDERCDSNGEAAQQIALSVAKAVCELAYIAADAAPADALTVAGRIALFAGVAICTATVVAIEINIAQCVLQDGLVNGAEIEAAYENSRIISGQVDDVKTDLLTHDTDIKVLLANIQATVNANGEKLETLLARQLEEIRLLHTPEGQRSTAVPACNAGPCNFPNR